MQGKWSVYYNTCKWMVSTGCEAQEPKPRTVYKSKSSLCSSV